MGGAPLGRMDRDHRRGWHGQDAPRHREGPSPCVGRWPGALPLLQRKRVISPILCGPASCV